MLRYFLLSCFVLVLSLCHLDAQFLDNSIDPEYIEKIPSKWVIGGQIGTFKDTRTLEHSDELYQYELASNVQPTIGVFLKYKNWPDVKIAFPISSEADSIEAKSTGFNISIHLNPVQNIIADLYYSKLKGYNFSDPSIRPERFTPYNNISTQNIAFNSFYIFNAEKFSFKHAFNVGQIQIKNAGSWMGGLTINSTSQEKTSQFFDVALPAIQLSDFESITAFQVALVAGYAQNWIFGKKQRGFMSLGMFFGPNFHKGTTRYIDLPEDQFQGVNYTAKFLFSTGFRLDNMLQLQFKVFYNDYGYSLKEVDLRNVLLDGELSIVKYLK